MTSKEKLFAYLQLFRLPNVFTAISNILMGFLFTKGWPCEGIGITYFLFLCAASCCLYIGGMVLNDFYDFETDLEERPQRPLPSGRINRAWAQKLGFGLLAAGILLAAFPGFGTFQPKSGLIAAALAVAIYLYDSLAKQTAVAPILMGSCRSLNILLGMSCGILATDQLLVAIGIGVYVAGITWFARCEAKNSSRNMLMFGLGVMLVGIAILGAWPWYSEKVLPLLAAKIRWPTLLVLLVTSVVRRCMIAIATPEPENVQNAVKHAIFSLVVLDAAVVWAVLGPYAALVVLLLLLPTMFLGKWIYST